MKTRLTSIYVADSRLGMMDAIPFTFFVQLPAIARPGPDAAGAYFILRAPNYKPLVTLIFDRRDKRITDDAVFAVNESHVVHFQSREGDPRETSSYHTTSI